MKRALIVLAVALPLLPLLADEPKSANTETKKDTTATAAPAAQPDSPLVAAAKRANRKGRKPSNLITNDTLKASGANAHVTTTTAQATINMPKPLEPPRPTPEMEASRQQAEQRKQVAEQAEKDRKAKEEKTRAAEQAAAAAEEGYDGMQDDAAEFVGANPPPPQF